MIETFTALLFAHVLADFVLQTNWINANKPRAPVMLLHGALVLLAAQAATGQIAAPWLLVLAAAHIVVDTIKIRVFAPGLAAFMTDQAAHLATLAAVAALAPGLWSAGLWADMPQILPLMALATGAIAVLLPGQYALGLLMRPHGARMRMTGLRNGGRQIGLLERGLIYLLVLLELPLGIGFLIGAKSILRFGTASHDQRSAEYVIIGTLASFGWALCVALSVQGLLSLLPALEIGALLS